MRPTHMSVSNQTRMWIWANGGYFSTCVGARAVDFDASALELYESGFVAPESLSEYLPKLFTPSANNNGGSTVSVK